MIFDTFNLYCGASCSDALIDISLTIRQLLANSISHDEHWNPNSICLIMNKEEDLEYKVFDL